jgi:hypothetical protein
MRCGARGCYAGRLLQRSQHPIGYIAFLRALKRPIALMLHSRLPAGERHRPGARTTPKARPALGMSKRSYVEAVLQGMQQKNASLNSDVATIKCDAVVSQPLDHSAAQHHRADAASHGMHTPHVIVAAHAAWVNSNNDLCDQAWQQHSTAQLALDHHFMHRA